MLKKIFGLVLIVTIIRGYVIFYAALPSGHGRLGDMDASNRAAFALLFVSAFIFWLWMFVDVLVREMYVWTKVFWLLMILFASLRGRNAVLFWLRAVSGTHKQQAPPDAPVDQPSAMPASVG